MITPSLSPRAPSFPLHPVIWRRGGRPLSLAAQYLLASLGVMLLGMVAIGAWVGQQIETGVLDHTASATAFYVDSVITPSLQSLALQATLTPEQVAALDRALGDVLRGQRVVAMKVWSRDGRVLYSPNPALIGRQFPIDEGLAKALGGAVSADISSLNEPENVYERQHWSRLLQVYAPVRQDQGGSIIGAIEFYQEPSQLEAEIATARARSWAVVAAVTLATYLVLVGIVKRGSDTIARQATQLHRQVAELSELHERVRQAAARTTTLNERALRRVSADLHDGPGQALALALLRLDRLLGRPDCPACGAAHADAALVQSAVQDALSEIRAISAGLRLPEVAALSVAEVAERAVHDHQRRSGTVVRLTLDAADRDAPLPTKIALLRSLQEALSNATRHGGGRDVRVHVAVAHDTLAVDVSDAGPGFAPAAAAAASGHLGLAGMRERAELLGGSYAVESRPGQGTTLRLRWPLSTPEEP